MSRRISQHIIDDIIARTDLIEIIQARIKIIKKGQNYSALCPFHNEKTPSFSINPQKQFYYCFGCGAHGNAIGFLMAYDHMSFIEAMTDLSAKLGIEIPTDSEAQQTSQQDHELLEQVSQFYQQQLRHSPEAIHYLKSRGLTGAIAKKFQLGFAPKAWDKLIQHFNNDANIMARLLQHGLIISKESKGHYDRFRHRIMYPIRNYRGKVIAFGARALGDELPKYLNSPDTPLFHKSDELYGLYETLSTNHQPTSILVTEGYMDVIALHQHGIHHAVATLGTASNTKHLQKLFRYTSEVIFCFDGDKAGKNAAWKALTLNLPLMRDGIQLRFMFLPEQDDPDTLIRRIGTQGFKQRLQKAAPLSSVFFELLKQESPLDTPDSKAQYANKATQYINQMPRGIFRELMLEALAKELNVYVSDLNSLQSTPKLPVRTNTAGILSPAQKACALLLQEPKLCEQVSELDRIAHITSADCVLLHKVVELLRHKPLSIGELIANLDDPLEQQQIARLASNKVPFSKEGILAEFRGALERLTEHAQELEANLLIQKAKSGNLTSDEKIKLTSLLTQRQKDII